MRWLVFLGFLIGCGGSDTCTANTLCSASPSNDRHYRFCNHGGASGCYYETDDGSHLQCTNCGSCENALALVTTWCESSTGTTGTTTSGRTTGNTTGNATQTCTSAVCPVGSRTYQFCATTGATDCHYVDSDGTTYACNSCTDCTGAASQVSSWCSADSSTGTTGSTTGTTGTTTGTTGSTTGNTGPYAQCAAMPTSTSCLTCCGTLEPDAYSRYKAYLDQCECPNCTGSCTANTDVCHGGTDFVGACMTCLLSFKSQCQSGADAQCQADPQCKPNLDCAAVCG
jgi:hypothetical protein